MSRKGNRPDNGATEWVFDLMKDKFFRDRTWPGFGPFTTDLDAYIVHRNTRTHQVKPRGPTPKGAPEPAPCRVAFI